MSESPEIILPATLYRLCNASQFTRISKEQGIVLSTDGIRHLNGALYLDVLELCAIDACSFFALEMALQERHQGTYVFHALATLVQKRILESYDNFNSETYCSIYSITDSLNLRWNKCEENDIPVISVFTDLFSKETESAYKRAMAENRNWLPIIFGPLIHSVGPVFTPSGFCLECFRFRIKENQSVYTWIETLGEPKYNNGHFIRVLKLREYKRKLELFANQWSNTNSFSDKLMALSLSDDSLHSVTKRPECSCCGDKTRVAKIMQASVELDESNVVLEYNFGYRSSTPKDTWDRLSHLVSPITGIIGNLYQVEETDGERFPVFSANFSIVPDSKFSDRLDFKMAVFGKGRNLEAARVSALSEGIERASARARGDEPIIQSSLLALGDCAIAPNTIQHFTEEQLLYPEKTLALGPVPKSYHQTTLIDWLPAWSLRDKERRFVPADAVLMGRVAGFDSRVAVFESNGLSAGNTKEEAILQGFLELIERDAVAIWWFNKLRRPPFDINIMKDDSWFLQTVSYLDEEKTETFFLDLTIDTKIPVVAAIGKFEDGYNIGYGSHFDARIAASRALSELVQIRALMAPVVPPDNGPELAYLLPDINARKIDADQRCTVVNKTTKSFIELGVSILSELGIDTIVVNCSRPDSLVPVVKVSAPGLRAFRPRFGEGRLYDIPVKMGLLSQPKTALEMNPFWMTI